MSLLLFPNTSLRTKATDVEHLNENLVAEMFVVMYRNGGCGLAANQIGYNDNIAVIDAGNGPILLVNPIITNVSGPTFVREACLSIPNEHHTITRFNRITVKAKNGNMEDFTIEATGLLAQIIQHEVDHLQGKLYTDYIPNYIPPPR